MRKVIAVIDFSEFDMQKTKLALEKIGLFKLIEIRSQDELNGFFEESKTPDLIIMDISIPTSSDGLDFISKLRSTDKYTKMPIIITSKSDSIHIRNSAAKLFVKDYIVKPYTFQRLEKSVKSLIPIKEELSYNISQIENFNLSFENFVEREIKLASRINRPLSLILFSCLQNVQVQKETDNNIYSNLANSIIDISIDLLRSTDTAFLNYNHDVLILLPCTTNVEAKVALDKIISSVEEKLEDSNLNIESYFNYSSATFPDDGDDLNALIQSVLSRISNQNILKQISSIPSDKRSYIDKRYNQFRKWWF